MSKNNNSTVTVSESHTTDGTPLSKLGKGLDADTNGCFCSSCNHKGYHAHLAKVMEKCVCDEKGMRHMEAPCRACHGTGKFEQRNGIKVSCRNCDGTGTYVHPTKMVHCWECHGEGTKLSKEPQMFHIKCMDCGGAGEVPVANPVLSKKALSALAMAS